MIQTIAISVFIGVLIAYFTKGMNAGQGAFGITAAVLAAGASALVGHNFHDLQIHSIVGGCAGAMFFWIGRKALC
ncbi:MAG TPA: hypothetical protein V6C81_13185 [Planktothrix sp.]|jgi:hypothetical protein